jgi:hypothetical protein
MVALLGDGSEGARLNRMSYHTLAHDDDVGMAYAKGRANSTELTSVMAPDGGRSAVARPQQRYPVPLVASTDWDIGSHVDSPPRQKIAPDAFLYTPERAAMRPESAQHQYSDKNARPRHGLDGTNVTVYSTYEGF